MNAARLLLTLSISFCCLCLQAQSFDIYVSDAGNFNIPPWKIIKYDANGQNPSTFISSNLAWPQDILFMEDSNYVLVSNLNSGRINKYDINTGSYLGIFAAGIGGPTRMKIGPDTLLYVLQWNANNKVKRYQLDGTFVDDFTSVGVNRSIGMDWDSQGNLYVSSYNGDHVRKFGPTGADSGLFVNSNLAGPTNIWFDRNGDLLVSDYDGTAVKRFDSHGNFIGNFLTGLRNSEGVAFYPNGDILIGNGQSSSVKRYDSSGTYLNDIISSGSGGLLTPNAVVLRANPAVSIEESELPQFSIYPNIGTHFKFQFVEQSAVESILVYGLNGQHIQEISPSENQWDASHVTDGLYLLVVKGNNGRFSSKKVVVQH